MASTYSVRYQIVNPPRVIFNLRHTFSLIKMTFFHVIRRNIPFTFFRANLTKSFGYIICVISLSFINTHQTTQIISASIGKLAPFICDSFNQVPICFLIICFISFWIYCSGNYTTKTSIIFITMSHKFYSVRHKFGNI